VLARDTETGLSEATLLEISAADYAETFNIPEKQAYEQMKEASQTLFQRYVAWHDIHEKSGKVRASKARWVSRASYVDGAGIIQLRFAQDMVPYITRLEKEFTHYRLEKVAGMSSIHAFRIYELLIQWGSIGKREVELEWIKKTLMVDKEYDRLDNFKKWVLDVALSQINEFSDLTVSYTQRKTGRIVTHLLFTFSKKPIPKKEARQETVQEAAAAKPPKQHLPELDGKSPFRLAKAPIQAKTKAEYLQLRKGEEIELCIERANEYGSGQEKAGKPVVYGAIYRKAITEGWHQEKARQKAQEDTARKQAEASRQQAAEAKRAEVEKAERSKMEMELAAAWFSAMPDDEKNKMGSAFVAESNPVDVGNFKRRGYTYMGFQFFIKRKWLESEKPIKYKT
jgi:plasmid replication initiation protein